MTAIVETPTKLDLACGQSKREGFYGVDVAGDPDLELDLLRFPWPFYDDTVEEVHCSHFVEHVPHWRPWFPGNVDGLFLFMDEVYRICKHGAEVRIIHPYALGNRAFQDPTHERYIPHETWWYFNRGWREQTKLDHYPVTANFEVVNINNGFTEEWTLRSDPARSWASAHHWNVITDLEVNLRAIKA